MQTGEGDCSTISLMNLQVKFLEFPANFIVQYDGRFTLR